MPRTRKPKPPAPTATPEPASVRQGTSSGGNGPENEVLTLAEAAAYLKFSDGDVLRLVHEQGLPARRLAAEWRFSRGAIQEWLRTPPPQGSKEAQLAVAGAWKGDPYAEEELKAILERRGRTLTQDSE